MTPIARTGPVGNPIDEPLGRIRRLLVILLAVACGGLLLGGLTMRYLGGASPAQQSAYGSVEWKVGAAGLLCLLALVQLPMSGFLLAVLRGQRGLLSDRLRLAASVSGVAVMAYGWIVAGSGVRGGILVGAAVFALGAAALPAALVPPRLRTSDIGVGLLVLVLPLMLLLLGSFEHSMDHAHLAAMKADLRDYVTWQDRQRAAVGPGAPALRDTVFAWSAGVQVLEASADSGRIVARVGHQAVAATCAIFAGGTPVPPAVAEGTPACTDPSTTTSALFYAGLFYLAGAALVTALVAWRLAAAHRR